MKKKCVVVKNGKEITLGHIVGGKLYRVCTSEFLNVSSDISSYKDWHCRLGHVNYLNTIVKQNLVTGMSVDKVVMDEKCESCILGKMKRLSFPKKSNTRSSKPLELIHTDICGPMQVPSLGGSRYVLTFTDDFTRYCFVYFLKYKNEALSKLKEFINSVENSTGDCVKALDIFLEEKNKKLVNIRSDNGGEYASKNFTDFCTQKGISHQFTVPEQNGVSERLNQTLIDSARCMLIHANMPLKFWAEAVNVAVYVHNYCSTSSLDYDTPFKCWYKRQPDVSNLRVFGCICYMHVSKQLRQKPDTKARKMIFIGYPEGTKGFKVYDPECDTIFRSRDLIFMENQFYYSKISDKLVDEIYPDIDEIPDITECASKEMVEERNDSKLEENTNTEPQVTKRERKAPKRLIEEMAFAEHCLLVDEPKNMENALNSLHASEWKNAMDSEYNSLVENKTWQLAPAPIETNIIDSRWVFNIKRKVDSSIEVTNESDIIVIKEENSDGVNIETCIENMDTSNNDDDDDCELPALDENGINGEEKMVEDANSNIDNVEPGKDEKVLRHTRKDIESRQKLHLANLEESSDEGNEETIWLWQRIRERIESKEIDVLYCLTENMLVDIVTKGLTKQKFEKFRDLLCLFKVD